jgi:hypothetical protein
VAAASQPEQQRNQRQARQQPRQPARFFRGRSNMNIARRCAVTLVIRICHVPFSLFEKCIAAFIEFAYEDRFILAIAVRFVSVGM